MTFYAQTDLNNSKIRDVQLPSRNSDIWSYSLKCSSMWLYEILIWLAFAISGLVSQPCILYTDRGSRKRWRLRIMNIHITTIWLLRSKRQFVGGAETSAPQLHSGQPAFCCRTQMSLPCKQMIQHTSNVQLNVQLWSDCTWCTPSLEGGKAFLSDEQSEGEHSPSLHGHKVAHIEEQHNAIPDQLVSCHGINLHPCSRCSNCRQALIN